MPGCVMTPCTYVPSTPRPERSTRTRFARRSSTRRAGTWPGRGHGARRERRRCATRCRAEADRAYDRGPAGVADTRCDRQFDGRERDGVGPGHQQHRGIRPALRAPGIGFEPPPQTERPRLGDDLEHRRGRDIELAAKLGAADPGSTPHGGSDRCVAAHGIGLHHTSSHHRRRARRIMRTPIGRPHEHTESAAAAPRRPRASYPPCSFQGACTYRAHD